eukprot:9561085-Alexandrium_andersonii.AAC.1
MPITQLAQHLQGEGLFEQFPTMPQVEGLPPASPNVFIDGSVDRPKQLRRALAGFGAWVKHPTDH